MTERDLPLEELLRAWVLLPWYHRKAIAIAIVVRNQMAVITNMGKIKVGYLISVLLLASITGVVFFIFQSNQCHQRDIRQSYTFMEALKGSIIHIFFLTSNILQIMATLFSPLMSGDLPVMVKVFI